jgi:hypothetical protein
MTSALRLLAPLALVAALGACAPEQPGLAEGTWVLDDFASRDATIPRWKAESEARFQSQISGMVAQPSGQVKYLRNQLEIGQSDYPDMVKKEFSRIAVTLTVQPGHRFVLETSIPEFPEKGCAGTYLLTETGEVHLVRREVDGVAQKQEQQSRLSGRIDEQGRLVIDWNELMVFVLKHQA